MKAITNKEVRTLVEKIQHEYLLHNKEKDTPKQMGDYKSFPQLIPLEIYNGMFKDFDKEQELRNKQEAQEKEEADMMKAQVRDLSRIYLDISKSYLQLAEDQRTLIQLLRSFMDK